MHQRYDGEWFLWWLEPLLEQRTCSLLHNPDVLLIIPLHLRRLVSLHGTSTQLLLWNDNYGEAWIGLTSHAPLHLHRRN